MINSHQINILWFKRDLRLSDHLPLHRALSSPEPCLFLYTVEPILLNDPHYDLRHWRFIWSSLMELKKALSKHGHKLCILQGDALSIFKYLHKNLDIKQIFSHQEIGLTVTFARDKQIAAWCQQEGIFWHETPQGAVIRGLKNRKNWDDNWKKVMRDELSTPDFSLSAKPLHLPETIGFFLPPDEWLTQDDNMQQGGSKEALSVLNSFFAERGRAYYFSISSPLASRDACSRLSPYLAWGCISLREVYQAVLRNWKRPGYRRSLIALSSRLHWHCHFIQKFESDIQMEKYGINRGYNALLKKETHKNKAYLDAWKNGKTGIPLIDACMRCLNKTGYINFRMRAMLVSFLTHHLNQDWRDGVVHLARLFLDFEPGIHYAQFQMQAGVTGINTIRIYNPTKQAKEQDSEGKFIYQWIPELRNVPTPLLFEPWLMTEMERQMFSLAQDSVYLSPIIDVQLSAKKARERLWSWRKNEQVKKEAERILEKHIRAPQKKGQQQNK